MIEDPSNPSEPIVDRTLAVYGYHHDDFAVTVREVGPSTVSFTGLDVAAVEIRHVSYCLAYRLTLSGEDAPAVTFGGDSEAFAELAEFAAGSNVFVHDCAHTDAGDEAPHATPSELGKVLAGRRFGRVYLTHLYPNTDGHHDEMLASVRGRYDGDVRISHDGLVADVNGCSSS